MAVRAGGRCRGARPLGTLGACPVRGLTGSSADADRERDRAPPRRPRRTGRQRVDEPAGRRRARGNGKTRRGRGRCGPARCRLCRARPTRRPPFRAGMRRGDGGAHARGAVRACMDSDRGRRRDRAIRVLHERRIRDRGRVQRGSGRVAGDDGRIDRRARCIRAGVRLGRVERLARLRPRPCTRRLRSCRQGPPNARSAGDGARRLPRGARAVRVLGDPRHVRLELPERPGRA